MTNAALALILLALPQEPPKLAPADEGLVKATVESLVRAMKKGDGEGFARLFDAKRLFEEIEGLTGMSWYTDARLREGFVTGMGKGLARMPAQYKALGQEWTGVRIRNLRPVEGKAEAEVFCTIEAGGERSKFRFWLAKSGGAWRIYDFESLEDASRASLLMSAFVPEAVTNPGALKEVQKAVETYQRMMAKAAEGDAAGALEELKRVSSKALPKAVAALMDMMEGALLFADGRNEEALDALDRAIRKRRDLPLAWHFKGEIHLQAERWEDCIAAEREYLRLLGDDAEGYLNLGLALKGLGRTDEAIEAHRKGAASDDEETDNRFRLGVLLLAREAGREEAQGLLLEVLGRSEQAEFLYDEAAEAAIDAGAPAVLLALVQDRLKRGEADAALSLHHGHALRRLGRSAEAEKVLRAAMKETDDDEAGELREELALTLGQLERAVEALALADEIEEKDGEAEALYVLAWLHAHGKKPAEALKALEGALKEDPDLHKKVAREPAFEMVRKDEKAAALLARAKAKSEYRDKAWDHRFEDRWEKLLELAQARTKAAPEDSDAWFDAGSALAQLERFEEAEKPLLEGLAKESGGMTVRFWEELGNATGRLGRLKDALGWSEKLLEEEWEEEAHRVAAVAYAVAKKGPEAVLALEKLLGASPEAYESVRKEPAFADLLKIPAVEQLLKKAKARAEDPDRDL